MRTFKLRKCQRVHGLHFTPDGSQLLVVGASQVDVVESVIWLDLASGDVVRRIDHLASCYALNADRSRLALGGCQDYDAGAAVQWTAIPDGPNWLPLANPGARDRKLPTLDHVFGLAFDPTGTLLAVGHGEQHRRTADLGLYEWEYDVVIMQLDPPREVQRIATGYGVGTLAFNPDGTRLAVSGGWEGEPTVTVFAQPNDIEDIRFTPPGTRTRCVQYLPDGRLVVASARAAHVREPDDLRPQLTLAGHKGQVNAVAPSPDGRRLLTASHDGSIRVWDASTGKLLSSFDWKVGPVTALACAPDGLTCAAAGKGGQVVLWDVDG